MRSISRLVVPLFLFGSSACQKAEFADPEATVLTLSLSSGVISADDASLTVTAAALADGVAVLEEPVTLSVGGACTAPQQTMQTDPDSGVAVVVFAGLDSAGDCTVSADLSNGVSASVGFQVVPGAPTSILVTPTSDTSILAGETVSYTVEVRDAASNLVPVAVDMATDAPEAQMVTAGSIRFLRAGQWTAFAEVLGFPSVTGTAEFAVTVDPASAAQVTTTIAQSSVGQQQVLDVTCTQMDAFGNLRSFAWDATDVTVEPAASVVEDATVNGLFHVSGFVTQGIYSVTCDDGANSDLDSFAVVEQALGNSVLATANRSSIEAGTGVLTVTCRELDDFGNELATDFGLGGVPNFTTTATGTVQEPTVNTFTVSNVTVPGSYTALCDSGTDQDTENFTVVDTTPPTITFNAVTAASGPEGIQADSRYAPGTQLTVSVSASDIVGISRIDVLGAGDYATFFPVPGTTSVTSHPFEIVIDPTLATFTQVVLRTQATDNSGNVRQSADLVFTVDPAKAIDVASGITLVTVFESPDNLGTPISVAVSSEGTLYVERSEVMPGQDQIIQITGETTYLSRRLDFVSGTPDLLSGGLIVTPTYGSPTGYQIFHTLVSSTGYIAALSDSNAHVPFSTFPTTPMDLAFGNVGGTDLFCIDADNGLSQAAILRVNANGNTTTIFTDTTSSVLQGAIAIGAGAGFLWIPKPDGRVVQMDGVGAHDNGTAGQINFGEPHDAFDIAIGGATQRVLVAGASSRTVYRATAGTRTVIAPVATSFDTPVGLTINATNNQLFILDRGTLGGRPWRIYRAVGY